MTFEEQIRAAINRCSKENGSDTPDWILARYLMRCLDTFDQTLEERERFYGRMIRAKDPRAHVIRSDAKA